MKKEDLTGRRFGRLVVIKGDGRNNKGERLWLCKCDCGNTITTDGRNLRRGDTKSCGCLKMEREILQPANLAGQKFGRLTAIEKVERRGKNTFWRCLCECGNECIVSADKLKSGHTTSCGCYQRERTLECPAKDFYDGTAIGHLKMGLTKANTTGIKGVSKKGKKFQAEIMIRRKKIYLGVFETLEEAAAVRKSAEEKYFHPVIEEWEATKCKEETKVGARPEKQGESHSRPKRREKTAP